MTNEEPPKEGSSTVLLVVMGCLVVTLGMLSVINSCIVLDAQHRAEQGLEGELHGEPGFP